MKKMIMMGLMVCLTANFASADQVVVNQGREGRTVSINGGANGVTQEIYDIMDKAGVQATHEVDGTFLQGKNATASVFYLNGARYSLSLTIDSSSNVTVNPNDVLGGKSVLLTGAVAQELLNDMEKAGVPHRPMMDAAIYTGTNITCEGFFLAGGRYSCTINVK